MTRVEQAISAYDAWDKRDPTQRPSDDEIKLAERFRNRINPAWTR